MYRFAHERAAAEKFRVKVDTVTNARRLLKPLGDFNKHDRSFFRNIAGPRDVGSVRLFLKLLHVTSGKSYAHAAAFHAFIRAMPGTAPSVDNCPVLNLRHVTSKSGVFAELWEEIKEMTRLGTLPTQKDENVSRYALFVEYAALFAIGNLEFACDLTLKSYLALGKKPYESLLGDATASNLTSGVTSEVTTQLISFLTTHASLSAEDRTRTGENLKAPSRSVPIGFSTSGGGHLGDLELSGGAGRFGGRSTAGTFRSVGSGGTQSIVHRLTNQHRSQSQAGSVASYTAPSTAGGGGGGATQGGDGGPGRLAPPLPWTAVNPGGIVGSLDVRGRCWQCLRHGHTSTTCKHPPHAEFRPADPSRAVSMLAQGKVVCV